MAKRGTAIVALVAMALSGCSGLRSNPTACKVTTFLVPAALGAAGGGLIASKAVNHGDDGGSKNWETAAGAGIGLVAGGLLGFIAGHFICREEEAPPPPPPPPPPPAPRGKIGELKGPHFAFDKYSLTAEGKARVDDAARLLKDHPGTNVSVNGYTDSIGSDAYNQRLSERRAKTVADRLIEDGIGASRVRVRGFGESNPIASNSTASGRAENRRVEIIAE